MCGFLFYHSTDIDSKFFSLMLDKLHHRGPDDTEVVLVKNAMLGFKRLSIMDLSHAGDQPFKLGTQYSLCNGEIYNYQAMKKDITGHTFQSGSDCEVLLPYYQQHGIDKLVQTLDAEYAFVIFDDATNSVVAARDQIGIRPLFYGFSKVSGNIAFGSEVKALKSFCNNIKPFPPGHYFKDGKFVCYQDIADVKNYHSHGIDEVCKNMQEKLIAGVLKRMQSDAPVGYLLSGGLDSSLVCAIAQKHSKAPIKTFAIGMSTDAIDLKYAKIVADHIGSEHREIIITRADALRAIRRVIYHLETWDITTIRASIGMFLICEAIHQTSDVKVLMTGEVSDELLGYKYTDFAPSAEEFQKEAQKRIRELYLYDVLRADRCISGNSLEARVPFSDKDFVEYVMAIDPKLKLNFSGHGKYLLRKAFEHGDYLPDSILWREKAAFSDAVGHSLVECLKQYADELYSEADVQKCSYTHGKPFTTESLMYRDIFNEYYTTYDELIPDFWMPNKTWKNCDVKDPSARVLPNYGASGS
jgi:asparagine synthase (glutamine-hydrolysing)